MRNFVTKVLIEKGWSCDRKYHVTTSKGQSFLLRVTPFEKSDSRADMFRMQQAAPIFACGMIDGYFAGPVPMEFWKLMALYVCSDTLGAFAWAAEFGEHELKVMQTRAKDVLQWYDNMQNPVPIWYRNQ